MWVLRTIVCDQIRIEAAHANSHWPEALRLSILREEIFRFWQSDQTRAISHRRATVHLSGIVTFDSFLFPTKHQFKFLDLRQNFRVLSCSLRPHADAHWGETTPVPDLRQEIHQKPPPEKPFEHSPESTQQTVFDRSAWNGNATKPGPD